MEDVKPTYYQINREKQLAQANLYQKSHRDQAKVYWKTYYLKNKEALKVKHREYVRKNKDRINAKQRALYYPRHQSKKKGEVVTPIVPAPLVDVPVWTMKISPGDHLVCFD
jgi:hypothetical protein